MADENGLMVVWADVDADFVTEFRRWHNCEHMSERVHIPGFITGRRYCGTGEAAMFMMYYETQTPEVLASQAYHAALNSPTPWTSEVLTHLKNPARSIYRIMASAGSGVTTATPFLATLRFNLSGNDEAILSCYRETILPRLAAQKGVARVRLWAIDEQISGIMTAERKIYGGGPGQQRYLIVIDLVCERQAVMPGDLPGLSAGDAARHTNIIAESGWLDFALEAPR